MQPAFSNGLITGTGSAINKACGFVPQAVELINITNGNTLYWDYALGAGKGILGGTLNGVNAVLTSPACAIGSTKDHVANGAFSYMLDGIKYTKAAVAAGTATAATTIPINKYGLFGYEIGTDGTIAGIDASGNATGYNSAALALAALPTANAAHVLFMYAIVMCTETGGFVGATNNFDDTGVTATFNNVANALNLTTGGITALEQSATNSTGIGFTLGTNANINVLSSSIYYKVWR